MLIQHSRGQYPVLERGVDSLFKDLPASSFVLTDQNVARALADWLPTLPTLVLEPGEQNKTLEGYGRCLRWLATVGATRKSTLIALGGGVIGDLGGFVASTYMRGIPFVQIPTSLLAQVDSSVGGKVGIDLDDGKNLVGAFYPPSEVRLSPDVLRRLPARQFANGMAEVWKYGAIMDAPLFAELAASRLTPQDPRLAAVVRRCIELKAQVVEADEFETTGLRAILNFGHTIGHAVETLTGYGPVMHGEAIAIGMVTEAKLGIRLGVTPPGIEKELIACFAGQGLPTTHPILQNGDAMISTMRKDKKAASGRLAFSLLTHIGGCKLIQGVNDDEVRAVLIEA
jgi:3-dehydroquinate synthase